MPWLQLIIPSTAEQAETIADAMMEIGAASVTLQDMQDQPVLEPAPGTTPLWSQTRVVGMFDSDTDLPACVEHIQGMIGATIDDWKAEPLEDRDWLRAWMDNFKPMRFGQRLWVVPGDFMPPEPDAVNLILDPGLAFGTGTHPTTAMCLQWLDAHKVDGQQIIDYGCGSGILAIAALLLGASEASAVDNDPLALVATEDNARKNQLDGQINTYLPQVLPADTQCDVLLANILAAPLISLAPLFTRLCKPGASIVLSGILANQAEQVIAAYNKAFAIGQWKQQDDWVCLSGTKLS